HVEQRASRAELERDVGAQLVQWLEVEDGGKGCDHDRRVHGELLRVGWGSDTARSGTPDHRPAVQRSAKASRRLESPRLAPRASPWTRSSPSGGWSGILCSFPGRPGADRYLKKGAPLEHLREATREVAAARGLHRVSP